MLSLTKTSLQFAMRQLKSPIAQTRITTNTRLAMKLNRRIFLACPTERNLSSRISTSFSSLAHNHLQFDTDSFNNTTLRKNPAIPQYLQQHYWWAYISPTMIRALDRQFLVDIVLWGNFSRLRDAAIQDLTTEEKSTSGMPSQIHGKNLQISCVYANLTEKIVDQLTPQASLDVIDVVPAQLENLQRKLERNIRTKSKQGQVTLSCHNASHLTEFHDSSYDQILIFFLLHETPDDVRRQVLAEAWRVLKPKGGKLVIIDYHQPRSSFWRSIMSGMYQLYEPFAYDLWTRSLSEWFPVNSRLAVQSKMHQTTFFGDLYQKVVITKDENN
jgi:ubiquinone/menaquinone biosynthesis C-methylase UbiE